MRTLSTEESAKVAAGGYAPVLRVSLEDAGGVFRDVDSYFGDQRFLVGVSLQEGVDDQGPTATITLRRELFFHSLSPLMLSSGTARGYVPSASPSPAVALYRRVKVEWYIAAADELTSSPTYTELFVGRIDSISVADGENVTLSCRDANVAVLSDSFFERERLYGLTPGTYAVQKGCFKWLPGETQAVGDLLVPSTLNGYLYRATSITTGVTGSTEPSWPTTVGNTVVDGGVTWTCGVATATGGVSLENVLQQMLNDSPVSLTLYAPDASSFLLNAWKQEREPILEAMRKLAQLIGWDVRPRYDSAGTYRFQLYKPDRVASSPARTFATNSYTDVRSLALSIEDIRNVVKVIYSDSADLGSDGKTPKRKTQTATDSASVAAYGRRYMEIAEEATSQVDTAAEASALAAAALADLSTPTADLEVEAFFFPWAQVGDLYRFSANNTHFDTDQDLAVVGVSHEAQLGSDGEQTFRTSLQCRGKPSGGRDRWLQWDSRPGVAPTHSLEDSYGGATLTVVDAAEVVGGARFRISEKLARHAKWDGIELHISTSNGFTPSAATLAAFSKADTVEVGNLLPGTTYYARAVPRQLNAGRVVLGQPSAQVSFTPGSVTTAKLADYAITTAKLSRSTDPAGAAVSATNLQDTAVTKVYRGGSVESVDNLFKKGSDTFASVAGTIASGQFGTGVVQTAALAAGAVTPAKLSSDVAWSLQPINGDFTSWTAGSGSPPDGWSIKTGTWGTDILRSAATPYSLSLPHTATSGTIVSSRFRVDSSRPLDVRVYGTDSSGTTGATDYGMRLDWYDSVDVFLSSSYDLCVSIPSYLSGGGDGNIRITLTPPTSAAYCRAVVGRLTRNRTATGTLYYVEASPVSAIAAGTVSSGTLTTNISVAGTLSSGGAATFATSSGNVGVGTSSPGGYGEKLQVSNGASAQASMMFLNPGIGSMQIGVPAGSSTVRIVNTYADGLLANGKGIDITSAGYVGVGTTGPSFPLDVYGSTYPIIKGQSTFASGGKTYSALQLGESASNRAAFFGYVYNTLSPNTSFAYITPWGSAEGSQFAVSASGKVGVGTPTPLAKLDIWNTTAASTTDAAQRWTWGSDTDNWGLRLDQIHTGSALDYAFRTRNSTTTDVNAIYIKANGYIGINNTIPGRELSVKGQISVSPTGTGEDLAYNGAIITTKPSTTNQHINMIRAGNRVWSIGFRPSSNNLLIAGGEATDSNFGNTQPFAFADTGNFGVGTVDPTSRLTVMGDASLRTTNSRGTTCAVMRTDTGTTNPLAQMRMYGSGTNGHLGNIVFATIGSDVFNAACSDRFVIQSDGHVRPAADNSYTMGVSGTRWKEIWCNQTSINSTSDARQKDDVKDSDLGLSFIEALRPVSYKWKVAQNVVEQRPDGEDENGEPRFREVLIPQPGKRPHYGFLAQEVEEAMGGKDFAGFIYDPHEDSYGLRYGEFIAPLVKAVQELSARVKQLEKQLADKDTP